jgi:hypothetical protein
VQTRFGDRADEYHKYVHTRNIGSQMMSRHHNLKLLQYRSLQHMLRRTLDGRVFNSATSCGPQQRWVLMVLRTPWGQHLRTTESTTRQNKRKLVPWYSLRSLRCCAARSLAVFYDAAGVSGFSGLPRPPSPISSSTLSSRYKLDGLQRAVSTLHCLEDSLNTVTRIW